MNRSTPLKAATPLIPNLICRSSLWHGCLLVTLGLGSLALSPVARAVDPAPDGGYPNQNTAEGDNALFRLTTGSANTALGFGALFSLATGFANTASGYQALYNNTGGFNTATGYRALFGNTTGTDNTANGFQALSKNTTGVQNTASGSQALVNNTIGSHNTATGLSALHNNTTGTNNTATGANALFTGQDSSNNTATGAYALLRNHFGENNTATGVSALSNNVVGSFNTANGVNALSENEKGSNNTANGAGALASNTLGSNNTADGFLALLNNINNGSSFLGRNNTAIGSQALINNTTGNGNIAIGFSAGGNLTTGNDNIDIGYLGVAGEGSTIHIGTPGKQNATFIAGIFGATVSGAAVIVDSTGHLGTITSSARFKEAIKPMDKSSEAILALRPVTFRYKEELDPDGIPQFGLIAEQVEKVNPDLVVRDEDGKVTTVRYEAVNAMLLNEFLKEHRKVQELEMNARQQQKQIETLTATVQKVSAQAELCRSAAQSVANNR